MARTILTGDVAIVLGALVLVDDHHRRPACRVVTSSSFLARHKSRQHAKTSSGSRRWVTKRDLPGRRRSSSAWISATVKTMPGGQPSMTQPIASPWLSPQVVTRKQVPEGVVRHGK